MIGRQYSFKFDLFINDEATTSGHNVIQAHPWIWVWYKKDKKILEIDIYNVNGRTHRSEIGPVQLRSWISVRIEQVLIVSDYVTRIYVNEKIEFSELNANPTFVGVVQVWTSGNHEFVVGAIKNIEATTLDFAPANVDQDCVHRASMGECTNNREVMLVKCAYSCNNDTETLVYRSSAEPATHLHIDGSLLKNDKPTTIESPVYSPTPQSCMSVRHLLRRGSSISVSVMVDDTVHGKFIIHGQKTPEEWMTRNIDISMDSEFKVR